LLSVLSLPFPVMKGKEGGVIVCFEMLQSCAELT
jgi:hypothetical protein